MNSGRCRERKWSGMRSKRRIEIGVPGRNRALALASCFAALPRVCNARPTTTGNGG